MSGFQITAQEVGAFLVLMLGWLGSLGGLYIAIDRRVSTLEINFIAKLENGITSRVKSLEESAHAPEACTLRAELAEVRGMLKGHA